MASPAEIVAAVDSDTFIGSPFSQPAGARATFRNPGPPNRDLHNVFTNQRGPDRGPLFYASLISAGKTTPVKGTEYLVPGSYSFFCSIHPGMDGVLQVTPGAAVPRPRVATRIPAQTLGRVKKSGRLGVRLYSEESTGPVSVVLRTGKRSAGTARTSALRAGETRSISVRLSARARRAIRKGKSVRFEATSVAEFGIPRSGARVLYSGGPK